MSLLKGAFAGAAIVASVLFGSASSQAASVGGLIPVEPIAGSAPMVEKIHGYHRRCRWSNRWGSHRHRRGRVRDCDDGPGIGFSFGYYYGPYLYWGPPLSSYRGHRRGRRVDGRRRHRGYILGNRVPGFTSGDLRPRNRADRPRVRRSERRLRQGDRLPGFQAGQFRQNRGNRVRVDRNRQLRQNRGNRQRQLRRKRSDLPVNIVSTTFAGWPTEIIGTLRLA